MKGIDVSTYQGNIDWEKVKKAGIEFAIIRGGFGNNNIDDKFVRNVKECNRLGIPCGVYWFSYAYNKSMAVREAQHVLNLIKPYRIEFPIYWDWEYDSERYAKEQGAKPTKDLVMSMLQGFCETIENAGYYAGNYTNYDYLNRYFTGSNTRFDTWLAAWSKDADTSKQPSNFGMWQHWNKGKVNGISGDVDMNVSYKDYPTLLRKLGLNNLKVKEKTEAEKALEWAKANGICSNETLTSELSLSDLVLCLYRFYNNIL